MKILVDSREQLPFTFEGYEVVPEVVGLPCGDYSLPGFEDRIAIERKSLDDLVGCLMGSNRERFERELARGRHYDHFAVVVEANLSDVAQGRYRSEMTPQAVLQSLVTFQVRYRVPFMWCGNRAGAQFMTFSLLAKYLREIGERYKAAVKHQGEADRPKLRGQSEPVNFA